jgi:hypothetical protein
MLGCYSCKKDIPAVNSGSIASNKTGLVIEGSNAVKDNKESSPSKEVSVRF